jgi:hypothetical protein
MLCEYKNVRVPLGVATKLQFAEAHGASEEQLENMLREHLAARMPVCPRCENNRQVWKNQITGNLTCHRVGCHLEIPAS